MITKCISFLELCLGNKDFNNAQLCIVMWLYTPPTIIHLACVKIMDMRLQIISIIVRKREKILNTRLPKAITLKRIHALSFFSEPEFSYCLPFLNNKSTLFTLLKAMPHTVDTPVKRKMASLFPKKITTRLKSKQTFLANLP